MSLFFEISIVVIAAVHTLIYFVDVLNRLEINETEERPFGSSRNAALPENVKHLYS